MEAKILYLCRMFCGQQKNLVCLFVVLLLSVLSFSSCSEYQRVLKGSDMDKKYDMAVKLYVKGDYYKALPLFEELMSVFRGTRKAEMTYYYYAYCHFNQGEYLLASYHFENFAKTFANSEFAEECQFMSAYGYYLDSPTYTLDQSNTYKAINELQLFTNKYSQSTKVQQCNDLIDLLRKKLQMKDYYNAKLYLKIGQYKASVIAFKNLIKDYPDSQYKEECMYLTARAHYELAKRSIEEKKEERFREAVKAYTLFIDSYPSSRFQKEAALIYDDSQKELEKFKAPQAPDASRKDA